MRVGSTFSGVGGIDLGLERAGHEIVFQCERDPYRRRVLARHWPGVPCFEDIRDLGEQHGRNGLPARGPDAAAKDDLQPPMVDLLVGGFPCQDLSVAGRRAGLAGSRSGLFFEFARLADELVRPGGWVLVENVPGLLSSNGGRDMGVVVATLADLGFLDLAYRVLDSRYLGVPQRRRRVFILARRAGGRRAAEVLLEPESGGGDFEASGKARSRAAADARDRVARPVLADGQRGDLETETFVSALDRKGGGADDNDAQAGHLVAGTVRSHQRPGSNAFDLVGAPTDPDGVRAPSGLSRRVDRCAVDPQPDGARYAACGDAVTVNVSCWLGRRLAEHG